MKKRLGMITRQVAATFRYKRRTEAHCKWSQNTWRNISNIKRCLFAGGSAPQNGGGTAGLFQNFWNPYYRGSWLFWRWPNANWTPLTGSMEWEDPPHRRFHATPSLRKILSAQSATRWVELLTKVVFPFFKTTAASLLPRWCLPPAGSSSAATATWSARSANRDKRFDLVLLAGRVDDNGNANDEHLHKDVPCKNWWKFMKIHSNVCFLGCPLDHRLFYETSH